MYRSGTMETKDAEENGYAFMKTSCMHCADPSCVSACPVRHGQGSEDRHRRATTPMPASAAVTASPPARSASRNTSTTRRPARSASASCAAIATGRPLPACAEVCPTGATLYGKTRTCSPEARAPPGTEARQMDRLPRGNISGVQGPELRERRRQLPAARLWREGVRRHAGAQASAVPFEKVGMPNLPEVGCGAVRVDPAHALRRPRDALGGARRDDLRRQA